MSVIKVPLHPQSELKLSTAILVRWLSRVRPESGDFAANPREVGTLLRQYGIPVGTSWPDIHLFYEYPEDGIERNIPRSVGERHGLQRVRPLLLALSVDGEFRRDCYREDASDTARLLFARSHKSCSRSQLYLPSMKRQGVRSRQCGNTVAVPT